MMPVRPRRLLHHGTVRASGLLFEARLLPAREAQLRVLEHWSAGAELYRLDDDLVLLLAAPREVRCDQAPGTPLTSVGPRAFTAVPLQPDELRAAAPVPGTLLRSQAGELVSEYLDTDLRADPAEWLEVGGFQVVSTTSLGAPPPPAELLVEPPRFDPRSRLNAPPAAAEAKEVLTSLERARGAGREQRDGVGEALGGVARALAAAYARLAGQWTRPAHAPAAGATTPKRKGPDPLAHLGHQALVRFLMFTRLSRAIGRRQARYLEQMLEMFQRSDLTEALRHAIPLGGGLGLDRPLPALGTPGPRDDLRIQLHSEAGGSSINITDELMEMLRKAYRRAFERLEAAGRIDEAAFVLAELLHAEEEAVAFLERHGRLRLAAELAEARELEPALVVRQWFVAGDRERAVLIARRTTSFAAAVDRLRKSHPELAAELRVLWAQGLADAGDYARAVEVIWPVPDRRFLAREWVEHGIRCGGAVGGRMLARKAVLFPERFDEVRSQLLELLEDLNPDGLMTRMAFGGTLATEGRAPGVAVLGRAAARALARDAEQSTDLDVARTFQQLVTRFGDGGLRADIPQLPGPTPSPSLRQRGVPLQIAVAAEDAGSLPVFDAALLPNGRTLVALGEAGVRLLTRDGRTVAHFPPPAHHLVLADSGDRALALADRGEAYRIARLDLVSLRSESWCEARLTAFAAEYDGSLWYVAAPEEGFLVIDATAPRWAAVWRTRDVGGRVWRIRRSPTHCTLLTAGEEWQRWTYSLPGPVLRYRQALEIDEDELFQAGCGVSADGKVLRLMLRSPEAVSGSMEHYASVQVLGGAQALELGLAAGTEEGAQSLPDDHSVWIVPLRRPHEMVLHLLEIEAGDLPVARARLRLHGARRASVRLSAQHCTVADDLGRLLVIDLRTGALLRDLRVR